MAANGDERQMAAWERIEATLDRMDVRLGGVERGQAGIEGRLDNIEAHLLRQGTDLDLLKKQLDATRRATDSKLDLLRLELLQALQERRFS